jgi:hypothetical protein
MEFVTRLKLNAEQFSSEGGRAAADLTGKLDKAGREIKQSFLSSFAEVEKLSQITLKMPRTEDGALNLGSEIAALNTRAVAFEQNAIAARELQAALLATAAAGHGDAESLRLQADAAMVKARADDLAADAARQQADVLGHVQTQLGRTTTATVAHADATRLGTNSAGAMRFAMQGLSYQAQDTFTQLSMGANVFQVLAIQGGQAAGAFANVEGKAGAVGRFLIGPWGLAVTAALLAFGPLVSKLWESGKASDEAAKRLTQAATAADSFGNAQTLLGKVIDLTTGKLKTQNAVLLQAIKLQNAFNLEQANAKIRTESEKLELSGGVTLKDPGFGQAGVMGLGSGNIDAAVRGAKLQAEQQKQLDAAQRAIFNAVNNDRLASSDPTAYSRAIGMAFDAQIAKIDKLASGGKIAGKNLTDAKLALLSLANAGNDKAAALEAAGVLAGGPVPGDLTPYAKDKKPKKEPKPRDYTRADNAVEEQLARMNAEWGKTPSLVAKAGVETLKLDNLIEQLQKRKLTPEVEKLIAAARATYPVIQEGMNRPFEDFVKQQRQSVMVQQLLLGGHDAEATALQNALRIAQAQGPLDKDRLATVLRLAEQQERITRALEEQRRVIGIYSGSVAQLQGTFRRFLDDLDGNTGSAVKGLLSGVVNDFKSLQRNLLTNALFGGIENDVEKYVRRMTGRQTPAEILEAQATEAGNALRDSASRNVSSLDVLTRAWMNAASLVDATHPGAANDNGASLQQLLARGNGVTGPDSKTWYGDEVRVEGHRPPDQAMQSLVKMSDVFGIGLDRFVKNLEALGWKLPAGLVDGLKKTLPGMLEGVGLGQLGGSVFSSITGGKDNKLASGIGGALGEVAGKELGKMAGGLLGKVGGPLGSIVGGVLGNLVGGLFNKPNWSNSSVTLNQWGDVQGGQGAGRGSDAIQAATGVSSSVAAGINTIADQLGATIKGLPALTLGTWNDRYRVALTSTTAPLNSNNFGNDILKDFGDDQQAAIEYAVRYSISHAVVTGISKASQNILASGQDLQSAINKALLIESVPKSLKEYYDPVGAAIDALNLKFQHIKDAMEEGGATAEQLAQAEQLYNIQLQQTKNSTASASQTLKDFQTSLKLGSSSPYSLRDQESTALSALRPFLEQINAGQAIDQSKYQQAAQQYLDVERQLYGSTAAYFAALDAVQAATNKAISQIDNVASIGTAVESPFAKATATAAQTTAANTQTGNELLAQQSETLDAVRDLLARMLDNYQAAPDQGFIGLDRGFVPRQVG